MSQITDTQLMKKQYATDENLRVRALLHSKYSICQQPFGNWVMEHYHIQSGMRVLELGCGNGSMWSDPKAFLPADASLLLTDFSAGMLEAAKSNVPAQENITFEQADIQCLPYADDSFDLVIANMMLYHVPDLPKALSEAARVLKPDGRFICATVGEHGVAFWLESVLGAAESRIYPFSLQNGEALLIPHFEQVEQYVRADGLRITETADLANYVLSMATYSDLKEWPYEQLLTLLERQKKDGVIAIPKEYGVFVCSRPKS